MQSTTAAVRKPTASASPGTAVIVAAGLVTLCCLGFAAANVLLETTDLLAGPTYTRYAAEYPVGLAVVNGLVIALKLLGAGLALLSVNERQRFIRPAALGVLLWAGFATLAVYNLGSVLEGLGMASGIVGGGAEIRLVDVGYVLFFALFAAGFGVLATSYSRRHHLPKRLAALGAVGAPVVLGGVLVAVPALLAAFGLGSTA